MANGAEWCAEVRLGWGVDAVAGSGDRGEAGAGRSCTLLVMPSSIASRVGWAQAKQGGRRDAPSRRGRQSRGCACSILPDLMSLPSSTILSHHVRLREELSRSILDLREKALGLSFNDAGTLLLRAANRLRAHYFEILVIGEFSRGKSAFINALLGQRLLPSGLRPTTPVITVIQEGVPGTSTIYLRNGKTSHPGAEELLQLLNGSAPNAAQVERVEIGSDHPLLSHGIRIVDTPGVNDLNTLRDDVTLSYLPKADAAIFLIDAKAPFTETEKRFLQGQVFKQNIDQVFFVINKADQLRPPYNAEDLRLIMRRVEEMVGNRIAETRVFALAAKPALDAAIAGDADGRQASRLPLLENELYRFLAHDRGAAVVRRASHECCDALSSLEAAVQLEIESVELSATDARTKADEVVAELAGIRQRLALAHGRWKETTASIRDEVLAAVTNQATDGFNQILGELEGIAPELYVTRDDALRDRTASQLRQVLTEVTYSAKEFLERRMRSEAGRLVESADALGQVGFEQLRIPYASIATQISLIQPRLPHSAPITGLTLGVGAVGLLAASFFLAPVAAAIAGVVAAWGHMSWTESGQDKKRSILSNARLQAKKDLSGLQQALDYSVLGFAEQIWSSSTERLRTQVESLATATERMQGARQRVEQDSSQRRRTLLDVRASGESVLVAIRGALSES